MEKQTVIEAKNLDKVYNPGTPEAVTALSDVMLTIESRQFVSLIGPSGCGKSTLLRLIANLIEPTGGTLLINGKPPLQARQDRDYGMVFQAATLYKWRSVARNVQLPLEVMGFTRNERKQRAQQMLEMVELGEFGNHYPWQLSGGMQQRVAIARALAFEPSLLLMDEPFGALDEFTRERMNQELLRIWDQTHTTVVFVTHSIAEAVFLSNRVVVMSPRPGRIAEVIDIDLDYPRNEITRQSSAFFEKVGEVREVLRAAHAME